MNNIPHDYKVKIKESLIAFKSFLDAAFNKCLWLLDIICITLTIIIFSLIFLLSLIYVFDPVLWDLLLLHFLNKEPSLNINREALVKTLESILNIKETSTPPMVDKTLFAPVIKISLGLVCIIAVGVLYYFT